VAYEWYLLFTVKRPAWCSSRALMKESSEPQLKGEGGGDGGDGGSGEGLRMPVGVVRDFTVEEVFGTLEAWYTVQEGVVYGCEGLALGRPVGLEASGRQARKRRSFYRDTTLRFCFTLHSARIPCRVQHAIPYAARGLLVSG